MSRHLSRLLWAFRRVRGTRSPGAGDPEDSLVVRFNRALALQESGKLAEARAAYRELLLLSPSDHETLVNLGNVERSLENFPAAIECLQRAVAIRPQEWLAHYNLGLALAAEKRYARAIDAYRHAARLGVLEAQRRFRRSLELAAEERFDEAARENDLALNCSEQYGEILLSLGATYDATDQFGRALEVFRESEREVPHSAKAYYNVGIILLRIGRPEEAISHFRTALRLDSENADYHFNFALALLASGQFAQGWSEYEWRWQSTPELIKVRNRFREPRWDGEPLEGRRLLVHAEQGLGDTLQFVRFVPRVKQTGGRIMLECPAPLVSLLSEFPGIDSIHASGRRLPRFDLQVPLLSLPRILESNDPVSLAGTVPYIQALPKISAEWREKLRPFKDRMNVGIAWAGNPRQLADRFRSCPLSALLPLASIPGIVCHSIQFGPASVQLDDVDAPIVNWGDQLKPIEQTAALIAHLDLMITIDTAYAHLAGAMGRPVWVLLPLHGADWRWMANRADSPWYPSMRLFRQPQPGDWPGLTAIVQRELAAWAVSNSSDSR